MLIMHMQDHNLLLIIVISNAARLRSRENKCDVPTMIAWQVARPSLYDSCWCKLLVHPPLRPSLSLHPRILPMAGSQPRGLTCSSFYVYERQTRAYLISGHSELTA